LIVPRVAGALPGSIKTRLKPALKFVFESVNNAVMSPPAAHGEGLFRQFVQRGKVLALSR